MNSYFSRLAQRSSVASAATNAPPGSSSASVAPSWSEQSVETTVPVNALIANSESDTTASAIEGKNIHSSELRPSSATTQLTNTPSKPISAQQHQRKLDPINTSVDSSFESNILTTNSNFFERNSSQDLLNAETLVSLSIPNERGSISEPLVTSAKHASVTFDQPLATKPSSKESVTEDKAHTNGLRKSQKEFIERSSTKSHNIKSTPLDVELEIESTGKRDTHTQIVTPAHAVQSRHADIRVEQTKNIASAPVQTPALSLQAPRTATRSSIEVHIGKIELEIFSPTRKPVAPPAPVQVLAPRATPAAAFNPHRHYLRSR